MTGRERLQRLLRVRAECLRVPDEIIDRALARCARFEARAVRNGTSGRIQALTTATSPPVAGAAPGAEATVPSLGDAPAPPGRSGELAPGRIIAGYRIEGLLGKGGMGAVYRAIQLSMARPVAFKVLSPRLAGDPTFVGRFKREARAAGRLIHPNLITVHEAGEAAGLVFFSMELVEGRSLKELLRDQGRIPPAQAVEIAHQVLVALRFAHEKGVIHRDIKPDNIMLTTSGQAKIADLGLSRIEEGHASGTTELFKTEVGSFMGTPHYMAPEQSRDAHAADARADLYALGATLYHLVCGKPPFDGVSPMEVMVAAQQKPLVFPEPGPPKPLRELIAKLMEKDPARRPPDAGAALVLLDRLFPVPTAQAAMRRRPWWRRLLGIAGWMLAIAATIVLGLALIRGLGRHQREAGWQAVRAAAEQDAAAQHWSEALDRLAKARPGLDPASAADCDAVGARITAAWNVWALAAFAPTERTFREHLAAGMFVNLFDDLKEAQSWHNPAVQQRIDELLAEAGEAAERTMTQKRDGERPPGLQGVLQEWRDSRRRQSALAWQHAVIDPPGSVRIEEGAGILRGTGSARLALPTDERDLGLRVAWRQPEPSARLSIDLGGGAQAVFTPAGAVLASGGRSQPLAGGFDGQALHLVRRDGAFFALVRENGGPVPVRVDPGAELALRWQLGTAEINAMAGAMKLKR